MVTSRNVDCFLRLLKTTRQNISRLSHAATAVKQTSAMRVHNCLLLIKSVTF